MYDIESAALNAIAASSGDEAGVIQAQARLSRVEGRQNTGAGFYTTLIIEGEAPPLSKRIYPGPFVNISGLKYPASFILYAKDGRIAKLELAASDDDLKNFDFSSAKFSIQED